MGVHRADRIRIHANHRIFRIQGLQLLLHLLGARSQGLHGAAAGGAPAGCRLGVAAVVAHQPSVGTVIGESCAAPGALRGLPAVHAHQSPAVAPAVQKQYGLLPRLRSFADALLQRKAQAQGVPQFQLLAHIHNLHPGQSLAVITVFQGVEGKLAGFGLVHGFYAGGCGAEEHQRPLFQSPPQCHLFGGVPGIGFRLVGVLLLLVQDDKAQIRAGGKHRRAGSHHHLGFTLSGAFPLVVPLSHGKAAVKHRHLLSKVGCHQPQQLGGQGDFRHQ